MSANIPVPCFMCFIYLFILRVWYKYFSKLWLGACCILISMKTKLPCIIEKVIHIHIMHCHFLIFTFYFFSPNKIGHRHEYLLLVGALPTSRVVLCSNHNSRVDVWNVLNSTSNSDLSLFIPHAQKMILASPSQSIQLKFKYKIEVLFYFIFKFWFLLHSIVSKEHFTLYSVYFFIVQLKKK